MPFSHIGILFLRDANNYSDDIVVATAGNNETEDESINIDAAYAQTGGCSKKINCMRAVLNTLINLMVFPVNILQAWHAGMPPLSKRSLNNLLYYSKGLINSK